MVDAGPDASGETGATISLNGTVEDDGLPAGTLVTAWAQLSGPGAAVVAEPDAVSTTATFPTAGTYVLELRADDSELLATDTVTIAVADPGPVREIFSGRIGKKTPTVSFDFAAGEGRVAIRLRFPTRGNPRTAPEMKLVLRYEAGTVLASGEGPHPVVVKLAVPGGQHTLEVTGDAGKFRAFVIHESA